MAAEVEEELGLVVRLGGAVDRGHQPVGEHLVDVVRDVLELGDELAQALGRQRAAQLGEPQREQVHRRDLGDEGLGGGDADLEAGAGVEDAVGVAGGLRAHDVRDREHLRPALLRQAHGGERVGGLARLGDADDEVARPDDRVAVAVLGGDVHLDRDARPLLERVAADQAGVVRGAAGDDDDAVAVAQEGVVDRAELAEVDAVAARTVRSAIVSATASACSWISLSMNVS